MISRYALAIPVFGIFLVAMGGLSGDEPDDVGDSEQSCDEESDTVCIDVIITDSSDS
jgi:hypothetical protein